MKLHAGPLYVEDLENLLHESLLLSFNTEIEDGSLEEVCLCVSIYHIHCHESGYIC